MELAGSAGKNIKLPNWDREIYLGKKIQRYKTNTKIYWGVGLREILWIFKEIKKPKKA